jgi:hypothetical protein
MHGDKDLKYASFVHKRRSESILIDCIVGLLFYSCFISDIHSVYGILDSIRRSFYTGLSLQSCVRSSSTDAFIL